MLGGFPYLFVPLISQMPDTEICGRLMDVRGVGYWAVDMLMMITLCRPDIVPVTDYVVPKDFHVLYLTRAPPSPRHLLKLSEKWRPHRSAATLYLWRIADTAKKIKKEEVTF
jgi:DNA-3-methyladenine glycosylase II